MPTKSQRHQRNRRSAGATIRTNSGTYGHHLRSSSQNRLVARTRCGSVRSRRRLVEWWRWIRRHPRRPADRCARVVTSRTNSHAKVSGALATPRTSIVSIASRCAPSRSEFTLATLTAPAPTAGDATSAPYFDREDDVEQWTARLADAFRAVERAARRLGRKKIKPTPFDEKNDKVPFNASGVAQVAPGRFVFIDNHDSSALFELVLDADGAEVERISRRPLLGVAPEQLGDPEGLSRVDVNGEILLIAASSLCVSTSGTTTVNDGLVRVRYTPHGDLHAETMDGFRAWLLRHEPSLAAAGEREPDAGGLNIEGLAWDPRAKSAPVRPARTVRSRADHGHPRSRRRRRSLVDDVVTEGAVHRPRPRTASRLRRQGIRDISYDEQTGDFLILLGRSTSTRRRTVSTRAPGTAAATRSHCSMSRFHRSMKPEGVTTFSERRREEDSHRRRRRWLRGGRLSEDQ